MDDQKIRKSRKKMNAIETNPKPKPQQSEVNLILELAETKPNKTQ